MPAPTPSKPSDPGIQISLHIRHPTLQPAEITHEMQWEPVESFAVGEPCQSSLSAGAGLAPRLHTESYWVATLNLEYLARVQLLAVRGRTTPASREEQLAQEALRRLSASDWSEPFISMACRSLVRHSDFFDGVRTGGGSAKLLVTMSGQNLRLSPEVSRRLADLGMTLEVEFVSR